MAVLHGDDLFPTSSGATKVPNTTYTVWKATIPATPRACTSACPTQTFDGFNGDISNVLQNNAEFAKDFRQWVTLCPVTADKAGDEFFIQVQTDNGAGSNHFARGEPRSNPGTRSPATPTWACTRTSEPALPRSSTSSTSPPRRRATGCC